VGASGSKSARLRGGSAARGGVTPCAACIELRGVELRLDRFGADAVTDCRVVELNIDRSGADADSDSGKSNADASGAEGIIDDRGVSGGAEGVCMRRPGILDCFASAPFLGTRFKISARGGITSLSGKKSTFLWRPGAGRFLEPEPNLANARLMNLNICPLGSTKFTGSPAQYA